MLVLPRHGLSPERELGLRADGARRDASGAFLLVPPGTPDAVDRLAATLQLAEFRVELRLPAGCTPEQQAALKEGTWKRGPEQDLFVAGLYRASRAHHALGGLGFPVVWAGRGGGSATRLQHYQEQAGGDVFVLVEERDPDEWLSRLLIEGASHTWLQGGALLLLGPPAFNKTIATLAMEGAEVVYDPQVLARAIGTPATTGAGSAPVRPRIAKDMVANPCRFQVLQATPAYLQMLALRLDAAGERIEDQWHVPRATAVGLVQDFRDKGIELVTRRLDGRVRDYEAWSADLPEDEGPGRPLERPAISSWDLPGQVPGLKPHTVLDAHQVRGAAYIIARGHRCVVGDEMGLGKTLTAIASAQFVPGPKLVVCPSNARGVWRHEVGHWSDACFLVLRPGMDPQGVRARLAERPVDYVVVSYDGLARFQDVIRETDWSLCVLDEAHYLRNRRTRRVTLARELLLRVPRRVLLTGTPLMNNPAELRSLLYFVAPDEWNDAAWFRARFERPYERGTAEVRQQVVERLHQYLDQLMIRRVKADIFRDMPHKRTHVHTVRLSEAWAREYAEEEAQYAADHPWETDVSGALARLNRLRQLAVNGKLDAVLPRIRTLTEAGEKVVVFGFFLSGLGTVEDEFAHLQPVVLTGSATDRQREEAVRRFQEEPDCRLFVGQVHAAGQAITLTASRHVVFLDLVWNPSVMRQAMDRVHRRGQERDVHVHFYITEDTVEEDMRDVLERKATLVDAVVDDAEFRDVEAVQWEVTERLLERRSRRG